ncbi:MAG: Gfo/Idh/MocA family oxidoreductase [Candidatus Aenigmatarchaeota archaeon]
MEHVYVSVSGAAGYMGRNHLSKILKLQEAGQCELIAVCDPKLADLQHEYHTTLKQVRKFEYFDEMINHGAYGNHLVVISSPTQCHANQSKSALESSCVSAVLCEKPMAEYFLQAEDIRETQKYAKKPLMITTTEHFNPAFQYAKTLLPQIGEIRQINARRMRPPLEEGRKPGLGRSANVSFDCGVHDIANMLELYAEHGYNGVRIVGDSMETQAVKQNPAKDFFTGRFDFTIGCGPRKNRFTLDIMNSFTSEKKYRVTTFRGNAGELTVDYIKNSVRLVTPEKDVTTTIKGDSMEKMYEAVFAEMTVHSRYPISLGIASGAVLIANSMAPRNEETRKHVDESLEFWL